METGMLIVLKCFLEPPFLENYINLKDQFFELLIKNKRNQNLKIPLLRKGSTRQNHLFVNLKTYNLLPLQLKLSNEKQMKTKNFLKHGSCCVEKNYSPFNTSFIYFLLNSQSLNNTSFI